MKIIVCSIVGGLAGFLFGQLFPPDQQLFIAATAGGVFSVCLLYLGPK
jgi:hypothetical protein